MRRFYRNIGGLNGVTSCSASVNEKSNSNNVDTSMSSASERRPCFTSKQADTVLLGIENSSFFFNKEADTCSLASSSVSSSSSTCSSFSSKLYQRAAALGTTVKEVAACTVSGAAAGPCQFIDALELKRKLFDLSSNVLVILLDCRPFTDFNLKHIKNSVHLNCRDKLIKKRLATRKLTVRDLITCQEAKNNFDLNVAATETTASPMPPVAAAATLSLPPAILTNNNNNNNNEKSQQRPFCPQPQQQQQRMSVQIVSSRMEQEEQEQAEEEEESMEQSRKENTFYTEKMIVLYDDKTSDLSDLQSDSNPLKIVQENIAKQCGYTKECKILKGKYTHSHEPLSLSLSFESIILTFITH